MKNARLVLLVESCPWIREMLSGFLEQEGFAVASVANGAEARRELRLRRPEIVLFETKAMEVDRWRAVRELRATEASARVYLVSMSESEEEQWRGRAMGADVCLGKPLRLRDLAATLRRCSGHGRTSKSLCARLLGA